MAKREYTIYNNQKIYKEKILPMFQDIKEKCMEHKIPFFFTICVKNTEYESVYEMEKECFSDDIVLAKDYFTKLQQVCDDYSTMLVLNKAEDLAENPTVYNKLTVFMKEIHPLLFKMKKACNRLAMPFFFSVCVTNEVGGSVYYSDMLASVSNYIFLNKDIFPDLVNVVNGFETIKRQVLEIDMDDFLVCDGGEKL